MRLHNFGYLLKEGARNIFHNKLMSFACIGVLVACLLLIGSAVLLTLNVNQVVGVVEEQNEIVAYVVENASSDDIKVLDLALGDIDNILQVRFMDKEEALAELKAKTGGSAVLFEGLEGDENPLLDRYILRLDDLSRLEETVDRVSALEGIDKVEAHTEVAKILTGLKQVVAFAGAGIVLILVAVTVVIITNTIKLTVFSRRKEINIMKYVGATDMFIRMPFLVEGMLIGLFSAVLAFLLLGVSYTYLLQWAGENYGSYIGIVVNNAVTFREVSLYLLGGFSVLGVFIGIVGSGVFVRRYLKV